MTSKYLGQANARQCIYDKSCRIFSDRFERRSNISTLAIGSNEAHDRFLSIKREATVNILKPKASNAVNISLF